MPPFPFSKKILDFRKEDIARAKAYYTKEAIQLRKKRKLTELLGSILSFILPGLRMAAIITTTSAFLLYLFKLIFNF